MDYSLIISFLAYFAAVQLSTKLRVNPTFSVTVAVIVPFFTMLILKWIHVTGHSLPVIENLFSISTVTTVILQFAAAWVVFRKLEQEDGYAAWLGWGVGGAIIIVLLIPFVAASIVK